MEPKCPGINCPKNYECKRFSESIDTRYDVYFTHTPWNHKTKKCEFYVENDLLDAVKKILDEHKATD